jgi:hypothetical protein
VRQFADLLAYQQWFDRERSRLTIPSDCSCAEPQLEGTMFAWTLKWFLKFPDKHIRVQERYSKQKGLYLSQRLGYSFHYGNNCNKNDEEYSHADPVDIRLDNSDPKLRYHLHYLTPEHIYQDRIGGGLDLAGFEMFTFLNSVFQHRASSLPFDQILGFKVVKNA